MQIPQCPAIGSRISAGIARHARWRAPCSGSRHVASTCRGLRSARRTAAGDVGGPVRPRHGMARAARFDSRAARRRRCMAPGGRRARRAGAADSGAREGRPCGPHPSYLACASRVITGVPRQLARTRCRGALDCARCDRHRARAPARACSSAGCSDRLAIGLDDTSHWRDDRERSGGVVQSCVRRRARGSGARRVADARRAAAHGWRHAPRSVPARVRSSTG